MKEFRTIEQNVEETFYREYFLPCRTIELQSTDGEKRCFVECTEATDYSDDAYPHGEDMDIALHNVVRRLLAENENRFFFSECDTTTPKTVIVDGDEYWLQYKDITDQCTNHYWVRTRKPIIGFKGVDCNSFSVYPHKGKTRRRYEVGQTITINEEKMLDSGKEYTFFSPRLEKALIYAGKKGKVFLVVAYGLIYVKNTWYDLSASNLSIVKELTAEEISLLQPQIYSPKWAWNGRYWENYSNDDE
ncbi:MAG: hypothetical protein IKO68_04140 [Oscillospiraceae bacterium]|nr:hypothetical protein [Oscillospiraceae bacterium]